MVIVLCPVCKKNPVGKLHICPYDQDVNNGNTHCFCCDECTHECLMDI